MALLQNEDFIIWQLRTSYLTHIKDGIGERLITLDSSVLNDPSFRAAGWSTTGADIKKTYSPPIPTAITSDYFAAPPRSAGFAPPGFNDEDSEGGMVTGRGSTDTVGPGPNIRRKRRRDLHEEDDSSDLSDESDDEVDESRAAQQIKFAKMPIRRRSGSSPIRSSVAKGVEVPVTTPSRRSGDRRVRRGSLGTVEAMKQRARRDTTTSSEISSDNDLTSSVSNSQLSKSQVSKSQEIATMGNAGSTERRVDPDYRLNQQVLANMEAHGLTTRAHDPNFVPLDDERGLLDDASVIDGASGEDSTGESGTSYFEGGSASPLDDMNPLSTSITSARPALAIQRRPKKLKTPQSSILQTLIQKRPISTILPKSILGQLIKAQKSTPTDPTEIFQRLSGKGVPNPLYIRIYAFFSDTPNQPIEMPLQRTYRDSNSDNDLPVTVADAIGLSLWRYKEEKYQPSIEPSKLNVNRWMLRFVDDKQPELDSFPLRRTQPISNFTFINNSARGYRARSKEKSWDDFALVEATEAEYEAHKLETPKYEQLFAAGQEQAKNASQPGANFTDTSQATHHTSERPSAVRKLTAAPADMPNIPTSHSTPRTGPLKTLRIHYQSPEAVSHTTSIQVPTDTYLAEVLDIVCKKWNLDKAYHFLKVSGTSITAVNDRTVESMGVRMDLDLERSHFAGSLALSGSPASSSPNAPLILQAHNQPRRGGRNPPPAHPLAQAQDVQGNMGNWKRYTVQRKQQISFTSHHQYTLTIEDEYIEAKPVEAARALSSEKTRRFPISEVIGCKHLSKHPKQFQLILFKGDARKRYDWIAQTALEAKEIADEITRAIGASSMHSEGSTAHLLSS